MKDVMAFWPGMGCDGFNAEGNSVYKVCPATPDGPLFTIRSFTKFALSDIIHGGPLTMELHDNVFRNEDGERKVAELVKLFMLSGGHQLQLNPLNRQRLTKDILKVKYIPSRRIAVSGRDNPTHMNRFY